MSVIALASIKGSPGVTTAAITLGAVWPDPPLLVECDLGGGDVALRLRGHGNVPLNPDRGLLAYTVTGPLQGSGSAALAPFVQTAEGGLDVVVGLPSPVHAGRLLPRLADLAAALRVAERPVLVDCGRITPANLLAPVLNAADLLVLVTRPTPAAIWHLRDAVRWLAEEAAPSRSAVVVVGTPAEARDVADTLHAAGGGLDVVGVLADDRSAARAIEGAWNRDLDRTPLVRSARELASALSRRLAELIASQP